MRSFVHSSQAIVSILAVTLVCRGALAQEGFEGWNLEPNLSQAHLVMVARVTSISGLKVVEGAKTDVVMRQYRFEPVRLLKGLFPRDQLSMTSSDLGITEDATSPPPLKEGETRLLILTQQPSFPFGTFGCASPAPGATTFEERVPPLTGTDDPLVAAVETLIKVVNSQSRRERATLLVDRLLDTTGLAAVPLLSSLRSRADWAAADERAYVPLTQLARDKATAVRLGTFVLLRDMLASRNNPKDPQQLDGVAESLRELLNSDEANTHVRLAALEALGQLLALKAELDWPRELLIQQVTGAATYAERSAAATALSHIANPQAVAAVLDAIAALPLDELPGRETVYTRAAVRVDAAKAEQVLLARLKRSMAAGQSLEAEIVPLARMRSKDSLPLLLAAAVQLNVSASDRYHIAWALGQLCDDRAVPVLAGWLRTNDYQLREASLSALENIDSPLAAREARPFLKQEAHLPYKLRIARLLARHGIDDGYALATEHLADAELTPQATLVLAALKDPRTSKDLTAIVATRPDRRWYAAALSGLAAMDDPAAMAELQGILANDRNPLAADAAQAAGLASDGELLMPLAKLMQSRNKKISLASLVAVRRHLSGVRSSARGLAAVRDNHADVGDGESGKLVDDLAPETRTAIAEAAASLVVDAYVDADVRGEAFEVARLLGGNRFTELLSELADQSELEGTPLLTEVQAELRRSRGVVEQL